MRRAGGLYFPLLPLVYIFPPSIESVVAGFATSFPGSLLFQPRLVPGSLGTRLAGFVALTREIKECNWFTFLLFFFLWGGIIGFTLREDVFEESYDHDHFEESRTKFGYREKIVEIEKEKKWKLIRRDLLKYHTSVDEMRAKCYSFMYQVL